MTYLTNSLFDYRSPENNGVRAEFILDTTNHKVKYHRTQKNITVFPLQNQTKYISIALNVICFKSVIDVFTHIQC